MTVENAKKAIEEIRKAAIEHPAFDEEIYTSHDIDLAGEEGGNTCDWVCIAWNADVALAELKEIKEKL